MNKNPIEELIDSMIDAKEFAEYEEKKSVRFSVTLNQVENKRLMNVCKELGQARATFCADIIVKAIAFAEQKLGWDNIEYLKKVLEEIEDDEGADSNE